MYFSRCAWVLISAILIAPLSFAQTAQERAGEIKLWREYCNDPDPDLRTAYLEDALINRGETIKRICIRQALSSSDLDLRNLGLRAVLANTDTLVFSVDMPAELEAAIKAAKNDDKKLKQIETYGVKKDYNYIFTGLTVSVRDTTIDAPRSEWLLLGSLPRADDRYTGEATLIGDKVNWTGNAYLSRNKSCRMALALTPAETLKGTLQCDAQWAFPVEAALF